MSVKDAIKKMKCEEKECEHLDPNGPYTFCKALFTDDFCQKRENDK